MSMPEIRVRLDRLLTVVRAAGDQWAVHQLEAVVANSDEDLKDYIVSNALWGGAGSIADQAGRGVGISRDHRRLIEAALIELGELQMEMLVTNLRTETWTEVFRQWRREGV